MFQKKMQRAAVAALAAGLLLTGPAQAAERTAREAPGLLEVAWEWLVERVTPRAWTAASEATGTPAPPPPASGGGGEAAGNPAGDDGGAIDPNG